MSWGGLCATFVIPGGSLLRIILWGRSFGIYTCRKSISENCFLMSLLDSSKVDSLGMTRTDDSYEHGQAICNWNLSLYQCQLSLRYVIFQQHTFTTALTPPISSALTSWRMSAFWGLRFSLPWPSGLSFTWVFLVANDPRNLSSDTPLMGSSFSAEQMEHVLYLRLRRLSAFHGSTTQSNLFQARYDMFSLSVCGELSLERTLRNVR